VVTRTFTVFAASYDALGAAEADFQAVHEFYMVAGLLDTYDGPRSERSAQAGWLPWHAPDRPATNAKLLDDSDK